MLSEGPKLARDPDGRLTVVGNGARKKEAFGIDTMTGTAQVAVR